MTNQTNKTSRDTDASNNKNAAMLSYIWILCLIPLVSNKKSEFAQFHSKQGFVLFLLSFATIVPFFGQLLMIALIIMSVMGILKARNGEWWEMPVIYDWSKKIKL